jgi:hypothetical protein
MTNNVGAIACPLCGAPSFVRRASRRKAPGEGRRGNQGGRAGKLYVYCPDRGNERGCGAVIANGAGAQIHLVRRATLLPALECLSV